MAPPNELGGQPTFDGFVELEPSDLTLTLHRLTGWAIDNGIALDELSIDRPSLEDIYLELTGDHPSRETRAGGTEADGRYG
jgi:ABC-2 type transport system ATP-binding protein